MRFLPCPSVKNEEGRKINTCVIKYVAAFILFYDFTPEGFQSIVMSMSVCFSAHIT